MAGKALVLGGGGVTGVAWELGVLAGLAQQGMDLSGADLVVGTSAGSVVGAQLTSGVSVGELYAAQLAPPGSEIAARMGLRTMLRFGWVLARSRDPVRARTRFGRMALATRTVSPAERREVIEARLPTADWPRRRLLITAVDADSGEFTAFDAASGVGLVDAVGASCAVPGVWPPVSINGRRWIDGGMRSAANADLAAGCERIAVIAPLVRGFRTMPSVASQVAELRSAGSVVVVVSPDSAALAAIGRNVLDPAHRGPAARAGHAQAANVAAEVAAVWQEGAVTRP
jgi:NTE family protein